MRRNKKKLIIRSRYIFLFLLVICLVLLFFSYRYGEQFAPVKSVVNNVITPMQRGINTVGSFLSNKLDMLSNIQSLLEDNEKLKTQVDELKNINQMLIQEKYELNWYRELYELDQQYMDYPKVAAKVIGKETNSYYNVMLIDKGSEDGIAVNMNVIAGNGLVGIVTEVGKNWAKVRSIIDDESNVSGMFLKTSDTCMVRGDLELLDSGFIRVEMINMSAEIENDFEIVTSNISNQFLPGILIGYVSNIEVDSSNMTKKAYLTPVVDFEHLDAVLIITELRDELEGLEDLKEFTN